MGTGALTLILFAILTYWVKVGEKFRKKGRLNRILLAFFVTVVPLVIVLFYYADNIVTDKVPYITPGGLLITVVSVALLMVVPIIMEMRLDKKKQEIE